MEYTFELRQLTSLLNYIVESRARLSEFSEDEVILTGIRKFMNVMEDHELNLMNYISEILFFNKYPIEETNEVLNNAIVEECENLNYQVREVHF